MSAKPRKRPLWYEQISIVTICDPLARQRSSALASVISILFLYPENNVFVLITPTCTSD